jgi:hypothetical protein
VVAGKPGQGFAMDIADEGPVDQVIDAMGRVVRQGHDTGGIEEAEVVGQAFDQGWSSTNSACGAKEIVLIQHIVDGS